MILLYCSYVYVTGTVSRRCIIEDQWHESINCFRKETGILLTKVMMCDCMTLQRLSLFGHLQSFTHMARFLSGDGGAFAYPWLWLAPLRIL